MHLALIKHLHELSPVLIEPSPHVQEPLQLLPLLLLVRSHILQDRRPHQLIQWHGGSFPSFFPLDLVADFLQLLCLLIVFKAHMLLKFCLVATFFQVNDVQGQVDFVLIQAVIALNSRLDDVKHLIILLLDCSPHRLNFPAPITIEEVALPVDFSQVKIDEPQHRGYQVVLRPTCDRINACHGTILVDRVLLL